jgi:protein-tyrosine phosphatase
MVTNGNQVIDYDIWDHGSMTVEKLEECFDLITAPNFSLNR